MLWEVCIVRRRCGGAGGARAVNRKTVPRAGLRPGSKKGRDVSNVQIKGTSVLGVRGYDDGLESTIETRKTVEDARTFSRLGISTIFSFN